MADWIFQANPKHYDIVGALEQLDEIAWRVPQYTGDVHVGDGVFLWRSGKDASIVGVGRVASDPAIRATPEPERPFVLDGATEGGAETRVVLRVVPVGPISKARVRAIPGMAEHKICVAPMGTVFPLDESQSARLRSLTGDAFPPAPSPSDARSNLPHVFSWKDRRKDVYPLPGGYEDHLQNLLHLLRSVEEQRPTMDGFASSIRVSFGSSESNARYVALFLRRVGFVDEIAGLLELSQISRELIENPDATLILAQLHQRCRFVGEMLLAVVEPRSATEVLEIANNLYGMGWATKAQIRRRRGWLQSLGAIEANDDGKLVLTEAGRSVLSQLSLHDPKEPELPVELDGAGPADNEAAPVEGLPTVQPLPEVKPDELDTLVDELTETSVDSSSPDRFEAAVARAFTFLGFRAEQLGGSGKTDVVADADLGSQDSYRVIVDGKTTARGAVGDHQIDWDTIDEHRALHQADYVAIAGPAFVGSRLTQRAQDHGAILLTADDLSELVRQHAAMPLNLDEYRKLFTAKAGEADLESLTASIEASQRFLDIALASLTEIEEHVSEVGPMTARDLFLLLRSDPELEARESEVQDALDALASPLIGILTKTDRGYRPSSQRSNGVRRVRLLAQVLEG